MTLKCFVAIVLIAASLAWPTRPWTIRLEGIYRPRVRSRCERLDRVIDRKSIESRPEEYPSEYELVDIFGSGQR